jgi:polysaccharide biosynthesis transport protein
MQRTNLLAAARHWWTVLLLAVVLGGAAGYMLTSGLPVDHEARVRLLVGPTTVDNRDLGAAGHLTRTYGELVTSQSVIDGTIEALDLPYSPSQVRGAIRPTADSATRILIVRVRDLDPDRAANIANELAAQLSLLPTAAGAGSSGHLQVIDTATAGIPIGVPTSIIVGLAAFAALVAALTLIILLENLNRTIRSEEELVEVAGVDYLGAVAATGRRRAPHGYVVENAPHSAQAADYRMLATKVEIIAGRDGLRSVLVLGVGRAQGTGELAANVAKVLAERHHSVTLVDANPATREITTNLGLTNRLGLTDILEVNARSGSDTHPGPFTFSNDPRLFVIPFGRASGPVSPHATGAPWVLSRLLDQADFVLVNAAPADRSAASLVWAGAVDATVLVVPRSRVKRADLTHLIESLRLVGGNVIGVVFESPRSLVGPLISSAREGAHLAEQGSPFGRRNGSPRPDRSPTANDGGSIPGAASPTRRGRGADRPALTAEQREAVRREDPS